MDMPDVTRCDVEQCAYNRDQQCHALAITIGDQTHPMCDTFFQSSQKGGAAQQHAGVGACKVSQCIHNDSFECQASGITVSHDKDDADCMTFESR